MIYIHYIHQNYARDNQDFSGSPDLKFVSVRNVQLYLFAVSGRGGIVGDGEISIVLGETIW